MGSNLLSLKMKEHALLGRETAISQGVLKLGAHVNSLEVSDGAKGGPVFLKSSRDVVKVLPN